MIIEIDKSSGFCFGVIKAITKAEDILKNNDQLYCLGDIVHNQPEINRLTQMGLQIIDYDQFKKLKNCKVLIRAHGEPPETYHIAKNNNIEIIDATCPVVLKLQEKIKIKFKEVKAIDGQIVIYGKKGHPEVTGLTGQTKNEAIIVREKNDLKNINYSKPVRLFSQTTMSKAGFEIIKKEIKQKMLNEQNKNLVDFEARNTVCGQVSCREPAIDKFSKEHDVILFVSGKNSSNGKMLYEICKKNNPLSYFISTNKEIKAEWFNKAVSVGICGATSTPLWLLQQVAEQVNQLTK